MIFECIDKKLIDSDALMESLEAIEYDVNDMYGNDGFSYNRLYDVVEKLPKIDIADSVRSVCENAEKLHPYKIIGDSSTYSDYNQGWCDALDYILSVIDPFGK